MNPMLNRITSLFILNQDDLPVISEPTLLLAETSIGTYRWGYPIEERSIDELARLGYLASMRPALLLASLSVSDVEAIAQAKDDLELQDISDRLAEFHRQVLGEEARQARRNAYQLWKNWIQFKSDDRVDFTANVAVIAISDLNRPSMGFWIRSRR